MARMQGYYVMKNSVVMFDGTDFANNLADATLTPTQEIQTQKVLDPSGTIQDVDSPTYTFDIVLVQSSAADSLHDFLEEHNGETIEVVFQPAKGSGKKVKTFDIVVLMPSFGGTNGTIATSELSFPVVGEPVTSFAV